MPKQHLLETLSELQAELAAMQTVDPQTRADLERVIDRIQRQIDEPQAATPAADQDRPANAPDEELGRDEESLTTQLQDFMLGIEADHPQLTRAVNQVAAALANLGI